MPRPIIMRVSNADASKSTTTRSIEQASNAMTGCAVRVKHYRRTPTTDDAVLTRARDQQCGACKPPEEAVPTLATAPSPSTSAAFESPDIVSAIASKISDKTTLAALSRTDKTAHDASAPTLAASKARAVQDLAALAEGRFAAEYFPRYNPGLLRLSGKDLSGDDVDALVDLIKHNSILTQLDLRRCDIDVAGGVAIAAAVTDNKALTSLDLSDNNINVGGAQAFGAALEVNRTLITLDLSNNALCGKEKWMVYGRFGPNGVPKDMSGVEALYKAVEKASWPDGALRHLGVGDNFLAHYEGKIKRAMEKPAVLAERAAKEREEEEMFAAQRRACAEGRCNSSCIWCDHGPGC